MKKIILVVLFISSIIGLKAQDVTEENYWQAKVDFLEPIVNQSIVARLDYGFGRHIVGLVGGFGGQISEFDNAQFDTYEDKINFRLGAEYQYFLSQRKQNRGFFVGGDIEFGTRTIESKVSSESVENISVFTPGLWVGYLWKPFKKANLYVDLTIIHPRYTFGDIKKVEFQTITTPYEPENLFNFLGPWSIAWRF